MTNPVHAVVCYPNPPREKGLDEYLRIVDLQDVSITSDVADAMKFRTCGAAIAFAKAFSHSPSGRPAVVKSVTTRVIYDVSFDLTKVPGYADIQSGD